MAFRGADGFVMRVEQGAVIFQEGEAATAAFFIETGSVDLVLERDDGPVWLERRTVGEVIGETALLHEGARRTVTAIAVEPCTLRACERARILDVVDGADRIVRACLTAALDTTRLSGGRPTTPSTPRADAAARQFEWDLEQALAHGEFDLFLQPIVQLPGGALLGFEALARWQRGARGAVAPATFLAVAETTGLIVPMTRWAFAGACRLTRELDRLAGPGDVAPFVAVNLSARDVVDAALPCHLERLLAETGADPRRLHLEVTEDLVGADPGTALRVLAACRGLGLKLVLDDFGAAEAGLASLHRFPFDGLKIDGSLVRGIDDAGADVRMIRSILALAACLELPVVAEGVETERQATCLAQLGCPQGQGFLFARPVLAVDALDALRHSRERRRVAGRHERVTDARQ